MKSHKDLDIYNLAFEYAIEVHKLFLKLPKFELYEQGSQVRRSSKSIKDAIVYKLEGTLELIKKYDLLGGKIFSFMLYVEKNWKT